jgi:hypothetical protein
VAATAAAAEAAALAASRYGQIPGRAMAAALRHRGRPPDRAVTPHDADRRSDEAEEAPRPQQSPSTSEQLLRGAVLVLVFALLYFPWRWYVLDPWRGLRSEDEAASAAVQQVLRYACPPGSVLRRSHRSTPLPPHPAHCCSAAAPPDAISTLGPPSQASIAIMAT